MTPDSTTHAKAVLSQLSESEQRELLAWLRSIYPIHALESRWGAPAEVILEAIARASDLSHRGVLGLIAEASFKVNVIDRLEGWGSSAPPADAAFDYEIARGTDRVRIQVKRQRTERRKLRPYRSGSSLFTVETQRTRSGKDAKGDSTRPYKFGEFDILAVSIQPATDDWTQFRYAPQRWLLPDSKRPTCLKVLQPVSLTVNSDWTGDFAECLDRLRTGGDRRIAQA